MNQSKTSFRFKLFVILGVLGFLTTVFLVRMWAVRDHAANYEQLLMTRLSGKFESSDISSGFVYFKIAEDATEYEMRPYRSLEGDWKNFYDVAEQGDSIFKAAGSDTLFLVKNGRTFVFTFREFND